ncbi:hypothetical protein P3W85_04600, partial [Cupriavidus basilensis]|nr:hypothetical protein [Cupriavidus basilensis]
MKCTPFLLCALIFVSSLFYCEAIAQDFSKAKLKGIATPSKAHIVGSCQFRIADMFGGHFRTLNSDGSRPQEGTYYLPLTGPMASLNGGFGLFCQEANERKIGIALGAKYVNDRWLKYSPWGDDPEPTPFDEQAHAQTVPLSGANWIGTALTFDDTTGDEQRRARFFSFCLIHQALALCGTTPVEWLANPKTNQLWKIKAILQSVQFVDTPASASSSGAASALPWPAADSEAHYIENGSLVINQNGKKAKCSVNGEVLYAVLSSDRSALMVSARGYIPTESLNRCWSGSDISVSLIPPNVGVLSDINLSKNIYVSLDFVDLSPLSYLALVSKIGGPMNLITMDGSYKNNKSIGKLKEMAFSVGDVPGAAIISRDGNFVAVSGEIDCGEGAYPGVWDIMKNKKKVIKLT